EMIISEAKKESKVIDQKFEDLTTYQSAIGSLIYLSVATRPDIAYAVNQAAQAMKNPTEEDWIKVKRIFSSLQGTKTMKIKYANSKTNNKTDVIGYSDASYGENR